MKASCIQAVSQGRNLLLDIVSKQELTFHSALFDVFSALFSTYFKVLSALFNALDISVMEHVTW